MKKLILTAITIYSAFALVACGQDNSANTDVYNCGTSGYVYNTATGSCQYAGIYNNVTDTKRFYDRKATGLQIVNSGAYKAFLKEAMGVCDRQISGWTTGVYKCDSWVSGDLAVAFSINSTMKPEVRFEAQPVASYFNGSLGLYYNTGAVLNPLILNQSNTFSLINNSQGFEIRAQGSNLNAGGLRLIQIMVPNGTLASGTFSYEVYYPYNGVATKFATGTFRPY